MVDFAPEAPDMRLEVARELRGFDPDLRVAFVPPRAFDLVVVEHRSDRIGGAGNLDRHQRLVKVEHGLSSLR
jgi:hypothetical protein